MKPEELDYLRYRLSRACESLDEAKLLLEAGHLATAVNRLYYACFYCVSALLFSEGKSASKHSGIRALFDQDWVNTGRVTKELGRFYRRMFNERQKGDYADLVAFTRDEVETMMEHARGFVREVSKLAEDNLPKGEEST